MEQSMKDRIEDRIDEIRNVILKEDDISHILIMAPIFSILNHLIKYPLLEKLNCIHCNQPLIKSIVGEYRYELWNNKILYFLTPTSSNITDYVPGFTAKSALLEVDFNKAYLFGDYEEYPLVLDVLPDTVDVMFTIIKPNTFLDECIANESI